MYQLLRCESQAKRTKILGVRGPNSFKSLNDVTTSYDT